MRENRLSRSKSGRTRDKGRYKMLFRMPIVLSSNSGGKLKPRGRREGDCSERKTVKRSYAPIIKRLQIKGNRYDPIVGEVILRCWPRGKGRKKKETEKRKGTEERDGGQESEGVRRGSHDPRLAVTMRVAMEQCRNEVDRLQAPPV